MKRLMIAALLCLALLWALPAGASPVAPGTAKVTMPSNLKAISVGDRIYFGTYTDSDTNTVYDVPWIVVSSADLHATTTVGGAIPLLSEYLLGTTKFGVLNAQGMPQYEGSDLQNAMNAIYSGFSGSEQAAVANATIRLGNTYETTGYLPDQKLFPLYKPIYSLLIAKHITDKTGTPDIWWLRRVYASENSFGAYSITREGYNNARRVDGVHGVRPAFLLNPSAVRYATETGSASGVKEWTLTLGESARDTFAISNAKLTDTGLVFDYTGAQTGANEYLAYFVKDGDDNVFQYGKITQALTLPAQASGVADMTLPTGVWLGGDVQLYVVNEQDNGAQSTSYASPLRAVPEAYAIIKGQNSVFTKASRMPLSFTANGAYDDYTATWVDSKQVPSGFCTVDPGSTVVTLSPAYLETLSLGKHTLRIAYQGIDNADGGYASTNFFIEENAPRTGDGSAPWLWLGLILISCAALAACAARRRRAA